MKKLDLFFILVVLAMMALYSTSCENKDINEGEQFKPREIHEDIVFHFDTIIVDGIEYLILEKDNNNPHEGFGFMAFRANKLVEKQDTVLAYLKTIRDYQLQILFNLTGTSMDELADQDKALLNNYLDQQKQELNSLEKNEFQNQIDN